jgi:peptidoglycan/LPS O-acetylase OafA/YrhL
VQINSTHESASRTPSLDGFRAISIILVLIAHYFSILRYSNDQTYPPIWNLLQNLLDHGDFGVRCFFVLSGFLITSLLLKEEETYRSISLRQFYIRRVLRIIPIYYTYILFIWCVARQSLSHSSFLAAITFTMGINQSPASSWLLFHSWSLSIEEQFYLIWPAILRFAPKKNRIWIVVWGIVIVPVSRFTLLHFKQNLLVRFSSIGQGDAIMWGCMLALLWQRYPDLLKRIFAFRTNLIRFVCISGLFLSFLWDSNDSGTLLHDVIEPTMHCVFIGYLLLSYVLEKQGLGFRFLNHPMIRWIGVLSYSLYIWQQFFAPSTLAVSAWWRIFPQNICLVVVAGVISHYTIEKYFISLKPH